MMVSHKTKRDSSNKINNYIKFLVLFKKTHFVNNEICEQRQKKKIVGVLEGAAS